MIDTVVLRLYGISRVFDNRAEEYRKRGLPITWDESHTRLASHLQLNIKNGKDELLYEMSDRELEQYYDSPKSRKVLYFSDRQNFFPIAHTRSLVSPSHHYKIHINVNWERNFIQFDFSIPKFFYGTNLFQFVTNPHDTKFNFTHHQKLQTQTENLYTRFQKGIQQFFNIMFTGFEIDYTLLEVNRIDFCHNVIFNNQEDCLQYLQKIKEIKKNHLREHKGIFYGRSITFQTATGYFKIYYKGDEFKAHDSKVLRKLNEEIVRAKNKAQNHFPINDLQQFANKILRFEMTVRPKNFTYIMKRKIFRKYWVNDKTRNDWAELVSKMDQIFNAKYDMYKRDSSGKIIKDKKGNAIKTNMGKKYMNLVHKNRSRLKYFEELKAWFDRVSICWFYLPLDNGKPYSTNINNQFENENNLFNEFTLSKELFKECVKSFYNKVNEFTLSNLPSRHEFAKRIDQFNGLVEKNKELAKTGMMDISQTQSYHRRNKINKNNFMMLFEILQQKSFKDIEYENTFPKSTWKRYKAKLKDLGIDKTTRNFPNLLMPRIDFSDYYQEVKFNSKFKHLVNINQK